LPQLVDRVYGTLDSMQIQGSSQARGASELKAWGIVWAELDGWRAAGCRAELRVVRLLAAEC
jgi:hypothetical protein